MPEVLILGNGISRLSFHDFIKKWKGEVWGCNKSYLEYGSKLTRLTGHKEVMAEAILYREQHHLKFKIWGGHIGRLDIADEAFTCPRQFCKDSGTTLIAQALHEGNDVAVVGFDLGGPDIHSPDHEKNLKFCWIERWRQLIAVYGAHRIRFIGFDHMEFLHSHRPAQDYVNRYRAGRPHIPDTEYYKVWEKFTGKKAFPVGDNNEMVRVKFADGREVEMNDFIAMKMEKKGKVTIMKIREGQTVHSGKEKFTGEIPEIKAAELGISDSPIEAQVEAQVEIQEEEKRMTFSPRRSRKGKK